MYFTKYAVKGLYLECFKEFYKVVFDTHTALNGSHKKDIC